MQDTSDYDTLQTLKQIYETELTWAQKRLEELDPAQKALSKRQSVSTETESIIDSVNEMIEAYKLSVVKAEYNLTLISHQLRQIESHLTN